MGFPEQLKKARLNMDYTQQQVADLMGITKSTYCGYETGKRQPDVTKIKQLAYILNTSGDILLETGFDQKLPLKNTTKELNRAEFNTHIEKHTHLLSDIYNLAKELSEEEQDYILDMIKIFQKHRESIAKNPKP